MKKIWLIALIVLKAWCAECAFCDSTAKSLAEAGSENVAGNKNVAEAENVFTQLFCKNFHFEPYAAWTCGLTKSKSGTGTEPGTGTGGLEFSPGDLTLGAKLSVPFVEGRFYTRGAFWEDPVFTGDFFTNYDWNFGLSITDGGFLKKVPFVIKIGYLGTGGAFTKLNNPLLTTSVTPFYASVGSATAISANLPSSSSFSNPVSFFVQGSFGGKKDYFRSGTVNVFARFPDFCEGENRGESGATSVGVDENGLFWGSGTYAVSGLFKLVIPDVKKTKTSALNFGFVAGIFPFFKDDFYSEKSWFNKIRQFEDKSCFCGQLNALFSNSIYTGNVFLNVYQNPSMVCNESGWQIFGDIKNTRSLFQFCIKNENKFVLGNFTLGFSSFINPFEQILTPSGKILQRQLQTKLNLNYSTFIRSFGFLFPEPIIRIKYGASFYSCFLEDGFSCKAGLGIQLMDSLFLISFLGNIAFEENRFDSATATLKMNPSFGKIKPIFTQNLSFSQSSTGLTTSQKSTVSFNLGNKKPFSANCNFSATFTQKNGNYTKCSLDSWVGMNLVWKGVKCTGKVTVKVSE